MDNQRVYAYKFANIYSLYIKKVERKGKAKAEVDQILQWLTGYSGTELQKVISSEVTLETFFNDAPKLNPNRKLITGVICGVRIEEIKEPLMREIRYMDKLIDELANDRAMEKILRQ